MNAEPGTVPFAIAFDPFGHLVIAEAGTNAVSTFLAAGSPYPVGDGSRRRAPAPAAFGRRAGVRQPNPSRFGGDGGWADPPEHWIEAAESRMEAGKLADRIRVWLGELPARQREVVLLRDLEGMSSDEVCAVLALTEGNQRVLLHRGRSRLTQLFEDEFREVR